MSTGYEYCYTTSTTVSTMSTTSARRILLLSSPLTHGSSITWLPRRHALFFERKTVLYFSTLLDFLGTF